MRNLIFAAAVFTTVCVIRPVRANPQDPVRVTVSTTDAPIVVAPVTTTTPLRLTKEGSILSVIASEGNWYRVEFEDPQWGRRVGYIEKRYVSVNAAPAQQAIGVTIPESKGQSVVQPLTAACATNPQRGSMSATVDGVPWTTNCVGVGFAEGSWYSITGTDDRYGGAATFRYVSVVLPAKGGTGTFSLNGKHGSNAAVMINASAFSLFPGGRGTATITTYTSTHIVGTFAFATGGKGITKVRSVTVADGRFDITFTK